MLLGNNNVASPAAAGRANIFKLHLHKYVLLSVVTVITNIITGCHPLQHTITLHLLYLLSDLVARALPHAPIISPPPAACIACSALAHRSHPPSRPSRPSYPPGAPASLCLL